MHEPDVTRVPREAVFDTYTAYRAHLLDSVRHAEHSLLIFDHDLAQTGLEDAEGVEALDALARAAAGEERIRILVRTPEHIERHCPRLLRLVERFGPRIRIKVVGEGVALPDACFAVADSQGLVIRFHRDRPRGKRIDGANPETARYAAQFETIWVCAKNGPTGAPLGI